MICTTHPTPTTDEVPLYLAGLGSVGETLLRQLADLPESSAAPRIMGACTTGWSAWYDAGRAPQNVHHSAPASTTNWPAILTHLEQEAPPNLIFVDATGSVEVARYHARLLEAGIHVVTPSKHAFTQEQHYFDRLTTATEAGNVHYRYETTAGAGLPVVQTLQDLVQTGDRIHSIRGAVSGTLSFIFSKVRDGEPFSEAVRSAVTQGYAEPDVREDLSGEDVARKFIILARTIGLRLERSDLEVESLVPETLRDGDPRAFVDKLPSYDDYWQKRSREAAHKNKTLQYVGHLEEGRIQVGVEAVSERSPFGQLQGTDNLFELRTERYDTSPLRIRGPGAGPEVTAAGVLADILKVAEATR